MPLPLAGAAHLYSRGTRPERSQRSGFPVCCSGSAFCSGSPRVLMIDVTGFFVPGSFLPYCLRTFGVFCGTIAFLIELDVCDLCEIGWKNSSSISQLSIILVYEE